MARLGFGVQVTEEATEQRGEYPKLPDGNYILDVDAVDVKEKDKDTPKHSISVNCTINVREPEEFAGRKFFMNYNVQHPNAEAQRIGYGDFQKLLRALEIGELAEDADTDELRLKPFAATVGMGKDSKEKNDDGSAKYPARNTIKRYWYPDENNAPDPHVTAEAKAKTESAARSAAANNNRPAANDNKPAAAPAKAAGSKPWAKK